MSKQTFVIVGASHAGAKAAGRPADADLPLTELAAGTDTSSRPATGAPPAAPLSPWPHSRQEAEVDDIVRALCRYGVLTRARLVEVCGAAHWSDSGFPRALARAISTGRVRQLGDDLYEPVEPSIR